MPAESSLPTPLHLMLPGPTPLPQAVLTAMSAPMINHRSEDFRVLYREVEAGAKWLLETEQDLLMLAGSGTTGMEAALCNLFSTGDKVLAITQGSFSERFAKMAMAFGLQTDTLAYDWGQAAQPADLEARLREGQYKAVLMVHCETSTGVLNPLRELAGLCRKYEALSVVDAIASLSSTPLPIDEWQLDCVITASQKGYYAPAGLTILSLSERAWLANERATLPRFSLDLKLTREYAHKSMTPWTPPLPVFYALRAGFGILRAEGREAVQARHLGLMRALRAGVQALGFGLFVPDEAVAARSVTPVLPMPGLDPEALRARMLAKGYMLGAGLRKLEGSQFRIGHLGAHDAGEILGLLASLEQSLSELAIDAVPGAGVSAALAALRQHQAACLA